MKKNSENISVFAAVFGYLSLQWGRRAICKRVLVSILDHFACEVRELHAMPILFCNTTWGT
jgi:hypothetical protein